MSKENLTVYPPEILYDAKTNGLLMSQWAAAKEKRKGRHQTRNRPTNSKRRLVKQMRAASNEDKGKAKRFCNKCCTAPCVLYATVFAFYLFCIAMVFMAIIVNRPGAHKPTVTEIDPYVTDNLTMALE